MTLTTTTTMPSPTEWTTSPPVMTTEWPSNSSGYFYFTLIFSLYLNCHLNNKQVIDNHINTC